MPAPGGRRGTREARVAGAMAVAAAAAAAAACDLPLAAGLAGFEAELLDRTGVVESVRETVVQETSDYSDFDVELRSSTGLEVTARLRVPAAAAAGDGRTGVVVIGGRVGGRRAVEHVPADVPDLVIVPDYPAILQTGRTEERLADPVATEAAAWDVPAMVILLGEYLAGRPEVDPARIAVIGVSFGGLFAPIAAAADPRLRNLALLYTGGHLHSLVAANVHIGPPAGTALAAELATLRFQRFEPTRYLPRVAPRPVLIVNGLFDRQIPHANARALLDAARPPRDMVWLPTGHLSEGDTALIRELVDTAFARLPLLAP